MTDQKPLTEQQLTDIDAIAARVVDDPFYLSDCEGELQVWREKALTHVRRDETGAIEMYSFPSSYRTTDQVIEIDLDTWDPGEDATDDQRRQDIADLVDARAAVPALLAEVRRLRAAIAGPNAETLRAAGWTECSPEWLAANPGQCATAARVPGGADVSHWHPASEQPAVAESEEATR